MSAITAVAAHVRPADDSNRDESMAVGAADGSGLGVAVGGVGGKLCGFGHCPLPGKYFSLCFVRFSHDSGSPVSVNWMKCVVVHPNVWAYVVFPHE